MKQVFFLCLKKDLCDCENTHGGGATCELKLHWHVQSVNNATIT
jgi:hypothetical protein